MIGYQVLASSQNVPDMLQFTLAILAAVVASTASAAEPQLPPLAEHFGMEEAAGLRWLHLSSRNGDLPVPTNSRQQTAALIADLDKDGRNDFVLAFREKGPALVWYRRTATGWDRYVIEKICDIFVAEMAKWTESRKEPDNPKAQARIFYGDGRGGFRKTVFQKGIGFHEAQACDLDGDGHPDILSKPYNWETPRVDIWLNRGSNAARRGGNERQLPWAGRLAALLGS